MPMSRPSDLFAGKGSVAGKLKERRKAIEGGDASGGKKAEKKATGMSEAENNAEAIRKRRKARKERQKVKKAKAKKRVARKDLMMRGQK